MKNENTFILELCNFFSPNKEKIIKLMEHPLDYPYILGQLLYNRMGGVAYFTSVYCGLLHKFNREFRNTLKSMYQMNCIYTKEYKSSLNYISKILGEPEFSYALLKGSYLTYIYPTGLRTSNDIDVLINQEDISKISDILINEGFKQGFIRNERFIEASRQEIVSSRMNRGETVPFIKEIPGNQKYLEIDINFSLDYKAVQETQAVRNILSRARKDISTRKNKLFTLEKSDFLIHLCAHLFKEATTYKMLEMRRDLSLYKFLDIYYFIKTFYNGYLNDEFTSRVKELGLKKECYFAIYYTDMLFNISNNKPLIINNKITDIYDNNLSDMLKNIEPENKKYLKQIYDPASDKTYSYDMDFIDWVFCSDRKSRIFHEID